MAALYNWLPCFSSSSSSSPTNPKNRLGYEKVRLHEELGAGRVGRGGYRHTYDYKKDVTPIVSRAIPRQVRYTTPSPPPAYNYNYVCPPPPTPPPVYCTPPPPPPPPPIQITYHLPPRKQCVPMPNSQPIPVIIKQNFVSARPSQVVQAPPAYNMPTRVEMEMHARTAGPPAQSAHIHYAAGPRGGGGYMVKSMDSVSCGIPSSTTSSSRTSISAPLPPKGMTGGIGDYYASPPLGANSARQQIYAGHPFSGGGHYDPFHRDYTNRAILSTQPPRVARQTTYDPGFWHRERKGGGYALPPLPPVPPLPPLPPMGTLPIYQPYQAYGAYNAYAPYQPNYRMVPAPPVPSVPQGHERAHLRTRQPTKVKAVRMVAPQPTGAAHQAATGGQGCQTTGFPKFPQFPQFPAFPEFPNFPNMPEFPKYPARC